MSFIVQIPTIPERLFAASWLKRNIGIPWLSKSISKKDRCKVPISEGAMSI